MSLLEDVGAGGSVGLSVQSCLAVPIYDQWDLDGLSGATKD